MSRTVQTQQIYNIYNHTGFNHPICPGDGRRDGIACYYRCRPGVREPTFVTGEKSNAQRLRTPAWGLLCHCPVEKATLIDTVITTIDNSGKWRIYIRTSSMDMGNERWMTVGKRCRADGDVRRRTPVGRATAWSHVGNYVETSEKCTLFDGLPTSKNSGASVAPPWFTDTPATICVRHPPSGASADGGNVCWWRPPD